MLASTSLGDIGLQGVVLALELKRNLHGALLPLLEVTYDARPLALALHREGVFVVGRSVRLEAEDLDTRTRRFVHHKARTHHLCVVEYE